MKLTTTTPQKALKAFKNQRPSRAEIDKFKKNLIGLLDKINLIEGRPKQESEEHLKNDVRDFLRDTYYIDSHGINTKDKKDLVIHLGKSVDSEVGVIIEAKRPSNKNEMVTAENANKKAFHELVLYYLNERIVHKNHSLKQLVITNINEWYIIDANYFDKNIYQNRKIKAEFDKKLNDNKDNPYFYDRIESILAESALEIDCVYFDFRKINKVLRDNDSENDKELIALYKILSPQHLLKEAKPNDSNSLDTNFYKELLHIIGLEEVKEGSKNIIRRKIDKVQAGSLIEATIAQIEINDNLHHLPDPSVYGATLPERHFNIALELCITWINRILFLKLLEGQLVAYHGKKAEFSFLNINKISDFDELFKLFHYVLAVKVNERKPDIQKEFQNVPYLNSSLFEISELEKEIVKINEINDKLKLDFHPTTVLKDLKKSKKSLPTIEYIFEFLEAYDFASEVKDDFQNDKTIISASVLGKVFEKINGYKDGSIYTPAFITMYMCKQSIRLAVLDKFNEALSEPDQKRFDEFGDIKNYFNKNDKKIDIKQGNEIINSLKICDPAVGSGHFLVSALNEIISIKADLGILADENLQTFGKYELEIANDELIITDRQGNDLNYKIVNGKPDTEIQRLQKALFHEKETIIENCLFGVDINPNSVKICRLRLWIELLKNAYYKADTDFKELETLPNIDINIKCGNSLLSRFALDADLKQALSKSKWTIDTYKNAVHSYHHVKGKEAKKELEKLIETIKTDFKTEIAKNDPKILKKNKLAGELYNLLNQVNLFEEPKKNKEKLDKKVKLEKEIEALSLDIEDIKSNSIYKNAFEWRFEFPEILNDVGDFVGFDVLIGNPPYIKIQDLKQFSEVYKNVFESARTGNYDIYVLFIEKCGSLLKQNGNLKFILPHKFLISEFGKGIRENLSKSKLTSEIIHFGHEMIFEGVTTYTCIFSLKNFKQDEIKFVEMNSDELLSNINFSKINYNNIPYSDPWNFKQNNSSLIFESLNKFQSTFDNVLEKVFSGIQTSADKIYSIIGEKKNGFVFGKSKNQDENLKIEESFLKPLIKGDDIKRYSDIKSDVFVIFPYLLENGDAIPMNINYIKTNFPNGYEYLKRYESELRNRENGKMDFDEKWFLYNYPKNLFVSNQVKLVSPDITLGMNISKDYGNFCVKNGAYGITIKAEFKKYENEIIAILNSKLLWTYLQNSGSVLRGGYFRFNTKYILPFPVPNFEKIKNSILSDKVSETFKLKQLNQDTTALEKEIDQLVYQLYELTEEEIKIVEGEK